MNDPQAADAMASVAAAVTGPGTPESAAVTAKPTEWAVRMLALAGPALSTMVAWVIAIIGGSGIGLFGLTLLRPTLWPDAVAERRIEALAAIGLALCAILAVVVFRLASGGLKRIEAKAGPASMTVSTGD
ncbi:hypothetical protein [Brevundimonas sp. BAL3]|uniref:hypothetical protein n=1 Tax=Brevundimonas sp. BAL3 TaxID=391600 RepID=UPI00017EB71B|nr:hypothetical protein [Brevundimonas sp. BAL3]EDX81124.1 hypothetical protein BBAL3_2281 [Brevundimonas sp. BAL3]